jgi:hypothetical protein
MKKLIILALATFVFFPLSNASADEPMVDITTIDASMAIIGFNSSTKVQLLYANMDPDASSQGYAVMAKHIAGNKVIATTAGTNLMTTAVDEDCKGLGVVACLGLLTGVTALDGGDGVDNIDAFSAEGWTLL